MLRADENSQFYPGQRWVNNDEKNVKGGVVAPIRISAGGLHTIFAAPQM